MDKPRREPDNCRKKGRKKSQSEITPNVCHCLLLARNHAAGAGGGLPAEN
jgi:hypothetical protein